MSELPDVVFDEPAESFDLSRVHGYIRESLDHIGELGLNVAVPQSGLALARLPTVYQYAIEGTFYELSDRYLADALEGASDRAHTAASERAEALADSSLDAGALQAEVDKVASEILNAQVVANQQAISKRNGVLYVLRSTGHVDVAEHAKQLWGQSSDDDQGLSALESSVLSDEFAWATAEFMKRHKNEIQLLGRLTDRSGPSEPSSTMARHDPMTRIRSISAVTLTVDGTSLQVELPIDASYQKTWKISHDCGCGSSAHSFSRNPQTNWHLVSRLWSKFCQIGALAKIEHLLTSTRLFSLDIGRHTFLTDAEFGDASAPIYGIPQVQLNYSYCEHCGQEFLTRVAEGMPQEPSREHREGLPGRLMVREIVQFRGPADESFLTFVDNNRISTS